MASIRPAASLLPLFLLLVGSGCAIQRKVPSLAPRAIEKLDVAPADVEPPPPAIPDNAPLSEKLSLIIQQAKEADDRFKAALPETEKATVSAASASPGSEGWVTAQQAVTRLDSMRSPVREAIARLEAMQNDAVYARAAGELPGFDRAIAIVGAMDRDESAAIARVSARLVQP